MRREQLMIYLPLLGLVLFIILLYSPEITSSSIPFLSNITFEQKTSLTLTFSISIFAAIEGYATFKRAKMEETKQLIEDARNELEKAYGPLYTLLNKAAPDDEDRDNIWLEFEQRKKIDEIIATYPFMFSPTIYSLWQEKIRNSQSIIQASKIGPSGGGIDLGVYVELRKMINEEYSKRVKEYRGLIEK